MLVRLFSSIAMSMGLIFMIFIEDLELLVWGAWPCIAIGGICNHLANIKMCTATPTFKGTFMAGLAGSLGAGGSVALIMKRIMDDYGLRISDVFLYWLVAYLIMASLKIILWTPYQLPILITSDDEYSLYSNSILIQQCKGDVA